MATGTESKILAALLEHLKTLEFSPSIPVAEPGVDFSPPTDDDPYLRVDFIPNGSFRQSITVDPEPIQGLLQVSVNWATGEGLIKPYDKADAIRAHFKAQTFFANGMKIKIYREPEAASPIQEDHRLIVPVTIYWRAFIKE